MQRVLIIEDNESLAQGIAFNLKKDGLQPIVAHTGAEGLTAIEGMQPDLVILDLMLPIMDGFEVLRRLRARGNQVPVLILTAKHEENDRIRGFDLDADQYITKPFSLRELLARVHSVLRRRHSAPGIVHRFGEVAVDTSAREVTVRGEPVMLSPKAFDLLFALIEKRGRVVSRHELLRTVWGHQVAVRTRTVDMHIAELRRRLEPDPAEPRHILTVWKVGYRLAV